MNLSFMTFFEISNKKNHYALLGILLLLILFSSVDLVLDGFPYLSPPHLGIHIGLILLYFAFILVLLKLKPENKSSDDQLHAFKKTETQETVTQEVPPIESMSLASEMDQAFTEWQLTTAEKKIATLLILGHSLKEIADNCHRGEGTVRQHATTVYKKSQLSGRAKLTAYFLQDFIDTEKLLLPSDVKRVKRHLLESSLNPDD